MNTDELKTYFDTKCAEQVAEDIVELMDKVANDDNLEVDFRLSGGKMVGSLKSPNTWFKADALPGTKLQEVKDTIAETVGENFDEKDEAARDRMYERVEVIDLFRDKVRIVLNSGLFHDRVANTMRRVALGNVPRQLVPFDTIRFLEIEIGEACPDDYIISIQKMAKIDQVTGQFIEPPQSVNQDLFETHRETGKSFEDIIAEKKAAGDPRYECVAGVLKKRYSFEVHCRIAADFSFCDLPEGSPSNDRSVQS